MHRPGRGGMGVEGGGGGRTHSFVACLSHSTVDHASLSKRRAEAGGGGKLFSCIAKVV